MREVYKSILKWTAWLFFLVLLTVYLCGVIYFRDKFFPGTTINSLDASYKTVEEIERRVAFEVGKYRLLVQQRGGYEDMIRAADIEYHYISTGEAAGYKKEQNAFWWPVIFFRKYDYEFASSAVYDLKKLKTVLEDLTCLDPEVEEAPVNARLHFNGLTYELIKEEPGKKVIKNRLYETIRKAVEGGKTVVDVDEAGCYEEPEITGQDPVLKKTFQGLSAYTKARIEYTFGEEKAILDGSTINDWLSVDESGNVTLDENGVAEYVANLAGTYDTYNRNRYFQTNDGSYVEVPNGTYGWRIDRMKETEQIIQILKEGSQVERWPVYLQTAATRENCDLGDDYVEIDLTRQRLWMYRDGIEILESDFVSGNVLKGYTTPGGVFALYWKKSPSILKSDTPGDSYETPVNYWMPFNGGIGLHDALWRAEFGGEIYKTNGSHGCINLPLWAAEVIYENIEAGYPIICYYR